MEDFENFIARENIKRFSQMLEETTDERKKATLRQLLAEEKATLNALRSSHERL